MTEQQKRLNGAIDEQHKEARESIENGNRTSIFEGACKMSRWFGEEVRANLDQTHARPIIEANRSK